MIKKLSFAALGFIAVAVAFVFWLFSLLEPGSARAGLKDTLPEELAYIAQTPEPSRGKILAVVTSTDSLGETGKYTGYELTELARAYYVFRANGFEVDIASPQGGEPPAVLDNDDMGAFDYAFLNDIEAQKKRADSIPVATVDVDQYQAIFFVGGKGAMFDFPDNKAIQSLASNAYEDGKVLGAVCHGPAAFVNATLSDGQHLLAGKMMTGFTNEEELLLVRNAENIFPFLLQDELIAKGAHFKPGPMYLEQVIQDGNLITGQNPWSVWSTAERMVKQLGYSPVLRETTPEEHTVAVMLTYDLQSYALAKSHLESVYIQEGGSVDRNLLAIHGLVSVMQGKIGKSIDLIGLVRNAKAIAE